MGQVGHLQEYDGMQQHLQQPFGKGLGQVYWIFVQVEWISGLGWVEQHSGPVEKISGLENLKQTSGMVQVERVSELEH